MTRWPNVFLLVCLFTAPVYAEETLAQWAESINTPETQYKILQHIPPEGLGSATSGILDPNQVTMLFPKGDSWVQLTRESVWIPAPTPSSQPALVVTCLVRKAQDQPPTTATTYVFREVSQKPFSVSSGYGNREHVRQVTLPKLNRSFVVIESLLLNPKEAVTSETATLYQMDSTRTGNPFKNVWMSHSSARYFHVGFAVLHEGNGEDLILKETPPPPAKSGDSFFSDIWGSSEVSQAPRFTAYRWSDDHFVEDDDVFDSQFKDLPASTWQY